MSPRPYNIEKRRAASTDASACARCCPRTHHGQCDRRRALKRSRRQAGVARMTVYYQFGSKVGLLEASIRWISAARHFQTELPRIMFASAEPLASARRPDRRILRFWSAERLVIAADTQHGGARSRLRREHPRAGRAPAAASSHSPGQDHREVRKADRGIAFEKSVDVSTRSPASRRSIRWQVRQRSRKNRCRSCSGSPGWCSVST